MMPNRPTLATTVLLATIALSPISAQPARPPAFTAASIKPSKPDDRGIAMQFLPGRVVLRNLPLHIIVATAYNLPFQGPRLTGGPDWIRGERYDIEATADSTAIPATVRGEARKQRMRLMLQALL